MFPTLFELNGIGFHSWGLMVMLAFMAACLLSGHRGMKVGIDSDKLVPLYLIVTVFGLLGARLLHFVFAEPAALLANPLVFFSPDKGGFAFYGGVIGGVLSGAVYAKLTRIHMWKLADVAAPTVMLGLAIGRLGCFLAGCCHGKPVGWEPGMELLDMTGGTMVLGADFPYLALVFKEGVGVGSLHRVALFPTQLAETTAGLVLFAFLSWMWARWRRFDGQVLAAMLVLYGIWRATIEGFRGDTVRGLHDLGALQASTSQLVAGGLILVAGAIVAWRAPRGRDPERPFVPEEDEFEE